VGHGVDERKPTALDLAAAKTIATTLQALSTPSRLLILGRLREGPAAVNEIVEAVGMQRSAVSHQLRLLRNLGLVHDDRQGRTVVYRLYDDHVAQLLDEAVYHVEHLRLGTPDPAADHAS
jgi:ArsR family transcriptional regulator, nickel/cobalt-responsive transcriptional repressor